MQRGTARVMTLVAVLLMEVAVIFTQWTTLASIPSFPDAGGAASFGSTVFAAVGTSAYTLDSLSGFWTAVASRPISSTSAAVGALSGQRAIVAGGTPGLATVHVFDMQTGTWTVKVNLPLGVHTSAAGCDGQRFWVAAGNAPGGDRSELQEYDSDADVWTYKAPLPLSTVRVSGAYCDGTFIVSRDDWIHVYAVALDSWTTGASLPSYRYRLYGNVAAIAGFGFVVGGEPTSGNTQKLERCDIGNDVWTSLDPVPMQSHATATAITSAGLLVAIGHFPGGTYVHGFTTGFSATASLIGDPVVRTLHGRTHHLDLYPGVFNLLTTSNLLVSAVVEALPSLPPDENTVMTVVAAAGEFSGTMFTVDCSVGPLDSMPMVCRSKSSEAVVDVFTLSTDASVMTVSLPAFTIEISLAGCTVVGPGVGGTSRVHTPAWLDVRVHPRQLPLPHCTGLLCLNNTLPVDDYEVRSGCVFESNPLDMAIASFGVFDVSLPRELRC